MTDEKSELEAKDHIIVTKMNHLVNLLNQAITDFSKTTDHFVELNVHNITTIGQGKSKPELTIRFYKELVE